MTTRGRREEEEGDERGGGEGSRNGMISEDAQAGNTVVNTYHRRMNMSPSDAF